MREMTLVLPHFCNLGMLAEQQAVWMSYPEDLRARLHVVVVDDCSPEGQQPTEDMITVSGLGSLRLYRLLEKKRWNWLACRNLGAKVAMTSRLLLTDMDHVLPVETLRALLERPMGDRDAYRLSRVDAPRPWPYRLDECAPYKPHNDSWFLTRFLFFYDCGSRFVGGYDERLSGVYGSSSEFTRRVMACAERCERVPDVLIRYPREIIADASTLPSVYTRKGDPENDAEIKRRQAARALIPDWRPLQGLVPSELVYAAMPAVVLV